ncbi:MAG: hypothetical protein ACRCS9_04525 [Hyphomicrobium sp.]
MAFTFGKSRAGSGSDAAQTLEHTSHGGLFATVLSAIALAFSGLSYYDSSLKTADLAVYVPPMIHYARDGDNDVFNIPITIVNDGAQTGTVLNMELEVENLRANPDRKRARFHSAFVGDHSTDDKAVNRAFAPISIPGRGTYTETVRFYPMDDPLPFVVDDKGDYRFTLRMLTAKPQSPGLVELAWRRDPNPLTFQLTLPFISFQHLAFRRGSIAMFNRDWKPATSTSTEPAISRSMDSKSGESKSGESGSATEAPAQSTEKPPAAKPGDDAPAPNR